MKGDLAMISAAFVRGETYTEDFSSERINLMHENMYLEIESLTEEYLDKNDRLIFESATFDDNRLESLVIESGKNVFEKIGEFIISLHTKFVNFIKKVMLSIENKKFATKDYENKLNELSNGDPTLKADIIEKFKNADLSITDMKSLAEFDKTYKELVELSKKADIDPNSFRGKVEAFKDKFKDIDKSAVVNIAKAFTAVVTAAGCVAVLKTNLAKVKTTHQTMLSNEKKVNEEMSKLYHDIIKKNSKNKDIVDTNKMSNYQALMNLTNFYYGKYNSILTRDDRSCNTASRIIGNLVEMVTRRDAKAKNTLDSISKYGATK
jgi:hypothetical protein